MDAETLKRAVAIARRQDAHPRWQSAVDRAALQLAGGCRWRWVARLTVVIVDSIGDIFVVSETGCDCRAAAYGNVCWHLALRRIVLATMDQRIAASGAPPT